MRFFCFQFGIAILPPSAFYVIFSSFSYIFFQSVPSLWCRVFKRSRRTAVKMNPLLSRAFFLGYHLQVSSFPLSFCLCHLFQPCTGQYLDYVFLRFLACLFAAFVFAISGRFLFCLRICIYSFKCFLPMLFNRFSSCLFFGHTKISNRKGIKENFN